MFLMLYWWCPFCWYTKWIWCDTYVVTCGWCCAFATRACYHSVLFGGTLTATGRINKGKKGRVLIISESFWMVLRWNNFDKWIIIRFWCFRWFIDFVFCRFSVYTEETAIGCWLGHTRWYRNVDLKNCEFLQMDTKTTSYTYIWYLQALHNYYLTEIRCIRMSLYCLIKRIIV